MPEHLKGVFYVAFFFLQFRIYDKMLFPRTQHTVYVQYLLCVHECVCLEYTRSIENISYASSRTCIHFQSCFIYDSDT